MQFLIASNRRLTIIVQMFMLWCLYCCKITCPNPSNNSENKQKNRSYLELILANSCKCLTLILGLILLELAGNSYAIAITGNASSLWVNKLLFYRMKIDPK